jgi:hypothetical protein
MCGLGTHRRPPFRLENITEECAMPTSVIGLFENRDIARKMVDALIQCGCDEGAVETWSDVDAGSFAERLRQAGYDEDKARRYGEVLEMAGALVVAEIDDDHAEAALEIMRKSEALTPDALLEWSRAGRQGGRTEKAGLAEEEPEVGNARTSRSKRLKTEVS